MSAGTIAPTRRGRAPSRRRDRQGEIEGVLPPRDGGGDGGGRGPDGGGSDEPGDRARLGLVLLLLGVSTLFAVFLVAYLLLRRSAPTWPPPGAPLPPHGLWMSTLVLLSSSAALVRASRARDARALHAGLAWALALGVGFLLVQAILWRDVLASGRFAFSDAYGTIFYSLTGLHAVHVLGGLLFLERTRRRARREPAAPSTRTAVGLCSIYWHYMAGVWIVLFVVLVFLS
jgi:cytochrome c oxidase subunit 3